MQQFQKQRKQSKKKIALCALHIRNQGLSSDICDQNKQYYKTAEA
jgi:hypothetical protein